MTIAPSEIATKAVLYSVREKLRYQVRNIVNVFVDISVKATSDSVNSEA